jgi:hypothetical protein
MTDDSRSPSTKDTRTMSRYVDIAGGYAYASLRAGMTVRAPDGKEIYIQPGDDEATMMDNIEALDEIADDKRGVIADMMLGEYFA